MAGIGLSITIDKGLIEGLERLQARIPQAIAMGLNDGGDKVRTQVKRALQQQTNVKATAINARVRTVRAYGASTARSGIGPIGPGKLTYQIVVSGKPSIPIKDVVGLKVRIDKGGGVTAAPWQGSRLFQRSFQIKGRGLDYLMARLPGAQRFPIRKLYGPNLAKELGEGIVPTVFVLSVGEFVVPAIVRQVARVFNSK